MPSVSPSKKILIVEDDLDMLEVIKETLEENQFECETAMSAPEGLDKVGKIHPDLVLLDLMLPKMSGFGFIRECKHRYPEEAPPMIVLSSLKDREIEQEAMNLGAVEYLNKGCPSRKLLAKVRQHLDS